MSGKRNTMEDLLLGGIGLDDDDDDDNDDEEQPKSVAADVAVTDVASLAPAAHPDLPLAFPPPATATAATTSSKTAAPLSRPSAITQALHSQGLRPNGGAVASAEPASPFLAHDDFEPMPYFPRTVAEPVSQPPVAALTKPTVDPANVAAYQPMAPPPAALFKPPRRNALQLTAQPSSALTPPAIASTGSAPMVSNATTISSSDSLAADELGTVDNSQEQKQKKERFILFTRVLMKYLQTKDPTMHTAAKQVIRECAERNRAGDPAYASVSLSMQSRLKALLAGTTYWAKAENYLAQIISKGTAATTASATTTTTTLAASSSSSSSTPTIAPFHTHSSSHFHAPIVPSTTLTTTSIMPPPHPMEPKVHYSTHLPSTVIHGTSSLNRNSLGSHTPIHSSVTSKPIMPSSIHTSRLSTSMELDAEARKKEEINAKRKLQRKEAAARKKAKVEFMTMSTSMQHTPVSLGGTNTSHSSHTHSSFPTSNSLTLGGYKINNTANSTMNVSSVSTTPMLSHMSTPILTTSMMNSTTTTTTTTATTITHVSKANMDTTMEDSGIVSTSPVTMGNKKKEGIYLGKKMEEYQDWMEMIDHATPIQVSSLALLLGQDMGEESHLTHVHVLDKQRTQLHSWSESGCDPTRSWLEGWSSRNIVSARMAWARLRLFEEEHRQGVQLEKVKSEKGCQSGKESMESMEEKIGPSSCSTSSSCTVPEEEEVEYSNTRVTEWYNEDRAEEDAALALISEAAQLYVKTLLERSIQSALIRCNVDGIRLWHIQQVAASISTSMGEETCVGSVESTPCIPPLFVRLGCDVRRQRALADGNAAKICQRMEEALSRRGHVYLKRMEEDRDDSKLFVQRWVKDIDNLSDPMSLVFSTSMNDLARKPSCPNMSMIASQDAKGFFDVFGGKDYVHEAPLGRLSRPTCVMREDVMGPWVCEDPIIAKYRRPRGLQLSSDRALAW